MPRRVAIICCISHWAEDDLIIWGNNLADITAWKAAIKSVGIETVPTLLLILPTLSEFVYTQRDLHPAAQLQAKLNVPGGRYQLPDNWILLPEALGHELTQQAHQSTHLGGSKLAALFQERFLSKLAQSVSLRCAQCILGFVNPKWQQHIETTHYHGTMPREHWEVDFTEMGKPRLQGNKYLLITINVLKLCLLSLSQPW